MTIHVVTWTISIVFSYIGSHGNCISDFMREIVDGDVELMLAYHIALGYISIVAFDMIKYKRIR